MNFTPAVISDLSLKPVELPRCEYDRQNWPERGADQGCPDNGQRYFAPPRLHFKIAQAAEV